MNKVELHRALTRVLNARIPRDCVCELELLRDYIEESEPVKHGKWETWGYIFHGIAWKRCSVCGKTADVSYQALLDGKIEMATPSICGCCSARMDGDSDDQP